MDIANRLIDSITDRFALLVRFPFAGRSQQERFGVAMRSFPVGEFLIFYCLEGEDVFILRVVHGSRDLPFLVDSFF